MKFEMEFGWIEPEKIIMETHDFEKIQIIRDFIVFQESYGWGVEYDIVDDDDKYEELETNDS